MGLFSFPGKKKQDAVSSESEFYSRAEEEPTTPRKRSRRKQTEEVSDPVLPEKKRARRRLVGAVALVLAAIIGLPMVLDSEPKPLASDIAIEIPSKDKVKPAGAAKSPATAAEPVPEASLDKDEEIVDPPAKETALRDAAPVPVTIKPAPDSALAKPEAKPVPELKAAPKKTEKPNDEERAKALLEGKNEKLKTATASDVKNGKFSVQVAALASQDKVNELQNKLKGAGIKSYTSKVATQSGERIRIRIGPFSSKEEADKMRARLVKIGLGGTLVPA